MKYKILSLIIFAFSALTFSQSENSPAPLSDVYIKPGKYTVYDNEETTPKNLSFLLRKPQYVWYLSTFL